MPNEWKLNYNADSRIFILQCCTFRRCRHRGVLNAAHFRHGSARRPALEQFPFGD